MTPQNYIQSKLRELSDTTPLARPSTDDELAELIFGLLMSKKFRKYSASPKLIEQIKGAIRLNIEQRQPINVTFLHGAYKLWRLEESPEADWAELFALMYYSKWVAPICDVYEPGVWFDFYVDDLIVPKLNNVDISDIEAYIKSYQALINFLKQYQPSNLKMTITTVGSQFSSPQAFEESVQRNLDKLRSETPGGLPELSGPQWAMVELNTKVTSDQSQDPKWREKVFQLHDAYMSSKGEAGYHKNRPEKILAFTQPLPLGTAIAVGTTKDSIMKFWVGVGVLKPSEGSYRQIILSPAQLAVAEVEFEDVQIVGLTGKNFTRIRVLNS